MSLEELAEYQQIEAFRRMNTCCIAERLPNGDYQSCHRRMVGIWLNRKLRELSIQKRLPLFYNKAMNHYYICLYHRRMIRHEKPLKLGESLSSRDLSVYEQQTSFTADELLEINEDPLLKSNKGEDDEDDEKSLLSVDDESDLSASDHEDWNLIERNMNIAPSAGESELGIMRNIIHNASRQKVSDRFNPYIHTVMPPLHRLPAATLRRYKKHFGLSNRTCANNTKQQLLSGIGDHFQTIPVTKKGELINFLLTIKNQNILSYPAELQESDQRQALPS